MADDNEYPPGYRGAPYINRLWFKFLTGKKLCVRGMDWSTDTVLWLKQQLYEQSGIPVEQMSIMFAGRMLQDAQTLSETNMSKECTCHVIIKLTSELDRFHRDLYAFCPSKLPATASSDSKSTSKVPENKWIRLEKAMPFLGPLTDLTKNPDNKFAVLTPDCQLQWKFREAGSNQRSNIDNTNNFEHSFQLIDMTTAFPYFVCLETSKDPAYAFAHEVTVTIKPRYSQLLEMGHSYDLVLNADATKAVLAKCVESERALFADKDAGKLEFLLPDPLVRLCLEYLKPAPEGSGNFTQLTCVPLPPLATSSAHGPASSKPKEKDAKDSKGTKDAPNVGPQAQQATAGGDKDPKKHPEGMPVIHAKHWRFTVGKVIKDSTLE